MSCFLQPVKGVQIIYVSKILKGLNVNFSKFEPKPYWGSSKVNNPSKAYGRILTVVIQVNNCADRSMEAQLPNPFWKL